MSQASIARDSSVMALGTVISRVTGMGRDIAITAALGSSLLADSYAVANSLPNIVYILVAGGALNAVFIPQLVRSLQAGAEQGNDFADRLITLTCLVLFVCTLMAMVVAPLTVGLYLHDGTSAQLDQAIVLARYCLPQIFYYGVYTMFSQVLNSRSSFAAPMFAPIINNIVMIITAVIFIYLTHGINVADGQVELSPTQLGVLGFGTTLGVVLQAICLVPFLKRVDYRFHFRWGFRGYGLGKAARLARWTIGLVFINQLGFLVISQLATAANQTSSDGGLALYQRAFLVFMLPQSLITISIVTAFFPQMSASAAGEKIDQLSAQLFSCFKLVMALVVPASIFLIAFGPAIGVALFQWGRNDNAAAVHTGQVVCAFAVGAIPFAAFYILLRGAYARENTTTPFWLTVIYNLIAAPLMVVFFFLAPDPWRVFAIAAAYAISYWLLLPIAWFRLTHALSLSSRATIGFGVRVLAMSAVAGVFALGVSLIIIRLLSGQFSPALNQFTAIAALVTGSCIFGASCLMLARAMNISEIHTAWTRITTQLRRAAITTLKR